MFASDVLATVPPEIRAALATVEGSRLYLVGGFVRDALLRRTNHDLDLAVDGDPLTAARTLARRLDGAVVPLDPERGTYRVALRKALAGIGHLDLTGLRAPSLAEDLRLRDFTINALAVTAGDEPRLIDVTGGVADLQQARIRLAAPRAFADDPARLLRAVRFAVQLDFALDGETADSARAHASLLSGVSAERQRDELARILGCDNAYAGVRLLDDLGLLSLLLPELDAARGVQQPAEHFYEVFEHCLHTLRALDLMLGSEPPAGAAEAKLWQILWSRLDSLPAVRLRLEESVGEERPRRAALKLAGLLHDISKPETKQVEPGSGRMHFFGHSEAGAKRAAAAARRLRFSSREADYLALLVGQHLRPGMLASPGEAPTRRALYRFFRDLGEAAPDLLLLNLADHAAASGPRLTLAAWTAHVDYSAWLLRMLYEDDRVARPPKLLTGDDLMRELGLQPGRTVGRLLETVREAQAAGEVESYAAALTLARATLADEEAETA